MDPTDRRLEDLEVKVAYLEALVADLDALVRQATDRALALEREVTLLRQSAEQDRLPGTSPEKPPHY